jgi:hypothetical protein
MKRPKMFLLAAIALGALAGYAAASANVAVLLRTITAEPLEGEEALVALQPEMKVPPGSPAATQSPKSKYLPFPTFPNVPFGGQIGINASDSKPFWPAKVRPPKGAPNVLLIMTDDVGFAAPSTFGGVIPTPALDRVAKAGLRYNKVCSTALCSPTRAALITGRNHHTCHFGVVSEISTAFPGYDSLMDETTATIAAILRQYGYATGWWGKNHNTPSFEASQAGPFNRWPTGGYGFGLLLRLCRRRLQPVAAEPVPEHHADLPLPGQEERRMEPDNGDGQRRHRLAQPAAFPRPRPAVLHVLRPRRHARAAPPHPGVDREVQGQIRQRLE